jgi:hypothetical protein
MTPSTDSLQQLLDFLCRLEKSKIPFRLEHNRNESIMVLIAVPGERWEVEFFADGEIEVETFVGGNEILAGQEARAALEKLFEVHGD